METLLDFPLVLTNWNSIGLLKLEINAQFNEAWFNYKKYVVSVFNIIDYYKDKYSSDYILHYPAL
jgi:hypothetical protein